MVSETPMYTGADNIINVFKDVCDGNPYFSIWRGREIITQNSSSDVEAATKKMEMLLLALQQSDNKEIFTIKFHPAPDKKVGYITDKSPVLQSMKVRVCPLDGNMISGTNYIPASNEVAPAVWHTLQDIKTGIASQAETHNAIVARLEALENGGIDEPEIEQDIITRISGIMDKPWAQQIAQQLLPAITGFIQGLQQPQPNIRVNGMEDNARDPIAQKSDAGSITANIATNSDAPGENILSEADNLIVDETLMRLSHHCDIVKDLSLLADWVDKNPKEFQSMLLNLRLAATLNA